MFLQLKISIPAKQSVSDSRRRADCGPSVWYTHGFVVYLMFLVAVNVALVWEKQIKLNSAMEQSKYFNQMLQDLGDGLKLRLNVSMSALVSTLDKNEKLNQQVLKLKKEKKELEAEIVQLKDKLYLLGTQYNDCSGQLTACRQDLVETMRSKVDHLEQQNEQISRELGECNGKLLALKSELDDRKKSGD